MCIGSLENNRLCLLQKFARHFLETGSLRIELWCFDELEEEVAETAAETLEGGLSTATIEHISLAIDELDDLASQVTIELLNRPLCVEQHVQALVCAQVRQKKTVIKVHQLLGSRRERCVNFCEAAIGTLPEFGVAHSAKEVVDLLLLILRVGLDFQAIDLLKNLGLFV